MSCVILEAAYACIYTKNAYSQIKKPYSYTYLLYYVGETCTQRRRGGRRARGFIPAGRDQIFGVLHSMWAPHGVSILCPKHAKTGCLGIRASNIFFESIFR